jgi:uncharacterized membrane protein (UPF0127 family)
MKAANIILIGLVLPVGCAKDAVVEPVTTVTPPPSRNVPLSSYDRSKISVNGTPIEVYVADERAERADGLMFVKDDELGVDEGMVFVFVAEEQLSFWMENTLIPLDIAFLDKDGKILNILQMQALDPTPQPSAGPAKYAVEMHVGWFEKRGVKPGDKFDLSSVL